MAVFAGPKIIEDGLVFYLDPANKKGISPLANDSFNNAEQMVKNLISPSDTITNNGDVRFGNLNYYTTFAIDYPESSFGGSAANRDGITPGFNVTSGTKLYDFSRALHLYAYDNNTNSWLPTSYFNGLRASGHCYDSYDNSIDDSEIGKFVDDYNNIKSLFNNLTVIMVGSHRDDYHPQSKLNVMYDIGAPANLVSQLDSAPEWILIGKPGAGIGNAYGYAFENYSTDPTRVAHLIFPLPIYGTKNNYLNFNNSNYLNLPNDIGYTTEFTASAWFRSQGTPAGSYHIIFGGQQLEMSIHSTGYLRLGVTTSSGRSVSNFGSGLVDGNWHYLCFTFDGSTRKAYIDGQYIGQATGITGTLTYSFSNRNIGKFGSNNSYFLNGDLSLVSFYNQVLTAAEVEQNFEASRGRFGI